MRGLWFEGALRCWDDLPEPAVRDGEALVRVRLAGICNTDLEITRGYMAFTGVPGHEFVGELVEAAGELPAGTRVVGEINAGCGYCKECSRGLGRHCQDRTVLGIQGRNGCHAGYLTLPIANLHRVPDAVSDELAVLTEPLAAAYEVVEQRPPQPNEAWLVLGDGKLGLLVALVLNLEGADPSLAGRHHRKLGIAERWGIATTNADDLAMYGERTWDVVVDCTGSQYGLQQALELVRPRGTIILKTTVADPPGYPLSQIVIDEITVLGSRCGPFPRALEAFARIQQAGIRLLDIVDGTFPLARGEDAYRQAERRETLKVLLRP